VTKIKIVVDSTADLAAKWLQQYDIGVVPAFVNFGQESYADDGVAITRQQFYVRLTQSNPLPTTSAPPPGLSEKMFREALTAADYVIAICAAAKLSGIYNGMLISARNVSADRIFVIDSGSVSMGAGWQALAAAEAAAAGASLEDIRAVIADTSRRVRLYAALDTMEYLRRSGRVGWAAASFGSLLQIKPIVGVTDGNVEAVSRVRTFKNAVKEMVNLARQHAPLERLAVLHTNAPERGEELCQLLQDIAPAAYTVVTDVNTAIGTHVGPGGIGLALVPAASDK
jgi:DegV family protein with EDD domain